MLGRAQRRERLRLPPQAVIVRSGLAGVEPAVDHWVMSNLLSFGLVAAMTSTAFVAAQEVPGSTGQQDSVPSEFARFVKVEDGGHFDTAITTYEKDGVQVVFYAAVHIADRACYQALNERFPADEVGAVGSPTNRFRSVGY